MKHFWDGLIPAYPDVHEMVGWKFSPYLRDWKFVRDSRTPLIKGHVWIVMEYGGNIDVGCVEYVRCRKNGGWKYRWYTDYNCPYGDAPARFKRYIPMRQRQYGVTSMYFLNSRPDWQECVRIATSKGWKGSDRQFPVQRFL